MSQRNSRECDPSRPQDAVDRRHYIKTYACDTKTAFAEMHVGISQRSLERCLLWEGISTDHMDGTQPRVRLIKIARGFYHDGATCDRTQIFLCVKGGGNAVLEMFDTKGKQHFRHVVAFDSQFTDSIGVPPASCYRFQADPMEDLHLIAIEPSHCWPEWVNHPDYVNPGELLNTDFRRNYQSLSQMGDREPSPFYAPDPSRRARRHRIWGREVMPEAASGDRDFVKPFTHLVLYTFYKSQMNFEHYHPHSWEFVYCIQGKGMMRLRPFKKDFDPTDETTFPYKKSDPPKEGAQKPDPQPVEPKAPAGSRLSAAAQTLQSSRHGFQAPREVRERAQRRAIVTSAVAARAEPPPDNECRSPDARPYPVEEWGENWTSWSRDEVTSFDLRAGLVVLVPKAWLHHYEGPRDEKVPQGSKVAYKNGAKDKEADELLLTYAMQTPQPIMHLLEHEANGWNPPERPGHGKG